jgi:hypothetical protein
VASASRVVAASTTPTASVIDKPWPEVTVADCERLRDALDGKAGRAKPEEES